MLAAHLPHPGEARADLEAAVAPAEQPVALFGDERARADQRHLADQHVPQLRQLVEGGAPQHLADGRDPGEVGAVEDCAGPDGDGRGREPAVAAVRKQFGDAVEEGEPSLGGEDFALMAELVPSFQLKVGSSQPGRHDKLHNSGYQPDERCIANGVQALSRAALELLG